MMKRIEVVAAMLMLLACSARQTGGTGGGLQAPRADPASVGVQVAAGGVPSALGEGAARWRVDPRYRQAEGARAEAEQPLRVVLEPESAVLSAGERVTVHVAVTALVSGGPLTVRAIAPDGVVVTQPAERAVASVVANERVDVSFDVLTNVNDAQQLLVAADLAVDPVANFHVTVAMPLSSAPPRTTQTGRSIANNGMTFIEVIPQGQP